MKAIILAAGVGSRLRPYTDDKPKCLLEVAGHPVLEYQLNAIRKCGIIDIAIVTGYCGDKIKTYCESAQIPVTIIYNSEYLTTNNAYSIWLARDYASSAQDGCLVINSDLIFRPAMLKLLIDSPDPDAIIVDSIKDITTDMVKAQMRGKRIIHASKDLAAHLAGAEVVGPAKFSRQGAAQFMDHIEAPIKAGDKNRWFFYSLGDFGKANNLIGVENPGYFWAEIDTPEDLSAAREKTPANFIEID
ncbi:MAG: phosphocholine cytidylyltransferase family protein [Candidatus Spechtbacterales bacterium]